MSIVSSDSLKLMKERANNPFAIAKYGKEIMQRAGISGLDGSILIDEIVIGASAISGKETVYLPITLNVDRSQLGHFSDEKEIIGYWSVMKAKEAIEQVLLTAREINESDYIRVKNIDWEIRNRDNKESICVDIDSTFDVEYIKKLNTKDELDEKLEKLSKRIDPTNLEGLIRQIDDFTRIDEITHTTFSEGVFDVDFANGERGVVKVFYDPLGLRAKKEKKIVSTILECEELKDYVVPFIDSDKNINYNGYSVLITPFTEGKFGFDKRKLEVFTRVFGEKRALYLMDDPIMHRNYVLALYHTATKEVMDDPIMSLSLVDDFIPFEDIKENILSIYPDEANFVSGLESAYTDSVEYLRSLPKDCCCHFDPKDENWIGKVAIDFGNSQSSYTARDTAKMKVHDHRIYESPSILRFYDLGYLYLRRYFDNGFNFEGDFFGQDLASSLVSSARIVRGCSKEGKGPEHKETKKYFKTLKTIKHVYF